MIARFARDSHPLGVVIEVEPAKRLYRAAFGADNGDVDPQDSRRGMNVVGWTTKEDELRLMGFVRHTGGDETKGGKKRLQGFALENANFSR